MGGKAGAGSDGGTDGAAVGDGLRFGGAVDIGVGGKEFRAPAQVGTRPFQPFIGQRFIKAHHHKVGLRFGQRDARLKEALPQGRHPQKADAFAGPTGFKIVNGHIPGGEDIPPCDGDAHAGKAFDIFHRAAAGVIGEKQHPPPLFLCGGDKIGGAGQQAVAQINGAVQIQHKQPDALHQGFFLIHAVPPGSICKMYPINIA